mgnify:CR=1 FL=1
MSTEFTARGLGWAGVLPFLALPTNFLIDQPGWLDSLLISYGLIILAFLCGTLWMRALNAAKARSCKLVASNLIVLFAWPAILLPIHFAALLLALAFLAHLLIDAPWRLNADHAWYGQLRLRLSITVISILLLTAFVGIVHGF